MYVFSMYKSLNNMFCSITILLLDTCVIFHNHATHRFELENSKVYNKFEDLVAQITCRLWRRKNMPLIKVLKAVNTTLSAKRSKLQQ